MKLIAKFSFDPLRPKKRPPNMMGKDAIAETQQNV